MKKFVLCSMLGFLLIAPTACVPPQEPPVPPPKTEVSAPRVYPGATGVESARFGGRPLIDPRSGFVRPGATAIEP